jgi:hypothetical protein
MHQVQSLQLCIATSSASSQVSDECSEYLPKEGSVKKSSIKVKQTTPQADSKWKRGRRQEKGEIMEVSRSSCIRVGTPSCCKAPGTGQGCEMGSL